MDIELVNAADLDLSHEVSRISFQFYDKESIRKLSVRRITNSSAFDDLGRPNPRGLYDPALGITSYTDGNCVTCGATYGLCPGHFGHIELPFPVINPLHLKTVRSILSSSCWSCGHLYATRRERLLLLAKARFADATHPECNRLLEFYMKTSLSRTTAQKKKKDEEESSYLNSLITKQVQASLAKLPSALRPYFAQVDVSSEEDTDKAFTKAAKELWMEAAKSGGLLQDPASEFRPLLKELLVGKVKECCNCGAPGSTVRLGSTKGRMFLESGKTEIILSPGDIETQIAKVWSIDPEIFALLFGLQGRHFEGILHSLDHTLFFLRTVPVPPSRFRPSSKVGTMEYSAEHAQNLCYQHILQAIEKILEIDRESMHPNDLVEDIDEPENEPTKDKDSDGDEAMLNVNGNEGMKPEKPTAADKKTMAKRNRELVDAVGAIQQGLMVLFDNDPSDKFAVTGIRQQLEAKAGLFRMHMMGKRVNYSCRSVIGPDVFLHTNEVGIPESFAKLLTIPEPVTNINLKRMQQAVLNGPNVYPGAIAVEEWTNTGKHKITRLRERTTEKVASTLVLGNANVSQHKSNSTNGNQGEVGEWDRQGYGKPSKGSDDIEKVDMDVSGALPKRVLRHIRTGDVVLFNRQPTLHRVSIMAHKVRVLPGDRTLRFHYANCGSYNADFDGDEMNVHVPQDAVAQCEAEEIMLSSRNYIVPTSGSPIRGLIQDHIVAAALMSRRGTFLSRGQFVQLLYSATSFIMSRTYRTNKRYRIPLPAIIKPKPCWTGKQLLSAVLDIVRDDRPGLYLETTSKTNANIVGKEECKVLFRDGQLLRGTLDKSSLGASIFGAVHGVHEVYGSEASDDFLSALARLSTFYVRQHGHTTGVDDLLLRSSGEETRRKILHESLNVKAIAAANQVYRVLSNEEESAIDKKTAKTLEEARLLIEEMVRRHGMEADDRLDTAMKNELNALGSDVVKACLPSCLQKGYPKNGFSLMTNTGAKGNAVNSAQISCVVGSTVLEGKRVPRMGGSGATLPCFTPYDASPNAGGFIAGRFLTGIAPFEFFFHAMAGREGLLDTSLKTANSGYLQRCLVKHMEGVKLHYDYTVRDSDGSVLQFVYGDDGIDPCKSSWLMSNIEWQVQNAKCLLRQSVTRDSAVQSILDRRRRHCSATSVKKSAGTLSESTILEDLAPGALSRCGAVSELFRDHVESYLKKSQASAGVDVASFMEARYQRSTAEPGEAVGVIAAQGVGEPSTQMTLNTFHHAGSSSAHVTLGIPRLRELVMTAAKYPKTPSMTLPILQEHGSNGARKLTQSLDHIRLIDLLVSVEATEKHTTFAEELGGMGVRVVGIILRFPNRNLYEDELGISFKKLYSVVDEQFMGRFQMSLSEEFALLNKVAENSDISVNVNRQMKKMGRQFLSKARSSSKFGLNADEDLDGSHDEEDQKSLSNRKLKRRHHEDSDEEAIGNGSPIQSDNERSSSPSDTDEDDGAEDSESNPEGSATDSEISDEEKDKIDMSDEDSDVEFGGYVGKYDDIVVSNIGALGDPEPNVDCTAIETTWLVPVALCGRLQLTDIAKGAASKVDLSSVHNITKCFTEESDNGPVVITEGSNLEAVIKLGQGLVDLNRISTNDMYGILNMYGVEALRAALIEEFVKIFKVYGIPVNIRHLKLIADYMTVHGGYRSFSRHSMFSVPSVFQRITYETSMKFLSDAALFGSKESILNPSSAIAIGQTCKGGTGGFELLQPM